MLHRSKTTQPVQASPFDTDHQISLNKGAKRFFYAVAVGHQTGIFHTWPECQQQVHQVPGAKFKRFNSEQEARNFINLHTKPNQSFTVAPTPTSSSPTAPSTAKSGPPRTRTPRSPRSRPSVSDDDTDPTTAAPQPKKPRRSAKSLTPPPCVPDFSASTAPTTVAADSGLPEPPADSPHGRGELVCFIDGACSGNGRAGARAGWAAVWPAAAGEMAAPRGAGRVSGLQTNNRGEYTAALEAMRQADRFDPSGEKPLTLYTDSMLLIRSITEWLPNWKKRGWRKADGKPVLNQDLLELLDAAVLRRRGGVRWQHVSAHTGRADFASRWNDVVDRLAVAALQK